MRNLLLYVFCVVIFCGCLKKDSGCPYLENPIKAPASEEQAIVDYLSANGITATKHSSNMYYEILKQGVGDSVSLCSQIVIAYTGKLTNGTVFDQQPSAAFTLGSLIEGWKKGLRLIQKGGKIKLYVPPSLGYGGIDLKDRDGNIIIPANSILIFDVDLLNY